MRQVNNQIMFHPTEKHFGSSLLEDYIYCRVNKQNKNFVLVINGSPGEGKSWTALQMGKNLDPEFDSSRILFSAEECIRLFQSGVLHKGSVIVGDEASSWLQARNFMTVQNKIFGTIMQTIRDKNYIFIFTYPRWDMVDKQIRQLTDTVLNCKRFGDKVFATAEIQYPNEQGLLEKRNPWFNGVECLGINIHSRPPAWLINSYQAKKSVFQEKLQADAAEKMNVYADGKIKPQKQGAQVVPNHFLGKIEATI